MRHFTAVLLALVFAVTFPASTPVGAEAGGVRIAEILPSPADGEREFVELWNDGAAIDLEGWTLKDAAGTTFTFTGTTLPAGGRLVVWGGGEADARGPAWSRATVWNNGGDQAILADASGAVVDVFAYGDAAWPDGRSQDVPTAPASGRSLSLVEGAWRDTAPTPGTPTSTAGGTASATVTDVAPEVTLGAPHEGQAGATVQVTVSVHDGNGDETIVAWELLADGARIVNGSAAGEHVVSFTLPVDRDATTLVLTAEDEAGNAATVQHGITIRVAGLVIIMPQSGLTFPAFPPGADEVVTNSSFRLRNDAAGPITPRIDISDLVGPSIIPVVGRLDIGNTTWTTYEGPLTSLPVLQPGEEMELRLRLREIPTPLPAGAYGTSFTVIA